MGGKGMFIEDKGYKPNVRDDQGYSEHEMGEMRKKKIEKYWGTRESKADGQDKPVDEPKITSIRVETYGVDYGEPETIEPFNYYNWLMKQYSTTQSSND